MKKQLDKSSDLLRLTPITDGSYKSSYSSEAGLYVRFAFGAIAALLSLSIRPAVAQDVSPHRSDRVTIQGTVHNSAGQLVGDAIVRLKQQGVVGDVATKTNGAGAFAFSGLGVGSYLLSAEKSGQRSQFTSVTSSSQGDQKQADLVLADEEDSKAVAEHSSATSSASPQVMEFADKPNFTVAGVTDWTAVGGHGSDSSLRTSEALARETLTLKPENSGHGTPSVTGDGGVMGESESKLRASLVATPESFEANHRLGEFYLHSGRYRESIPLLQSSYKIDPTNSDNELDLAMACKELGDFPVALDHVQKLLKHRETAELHRVAGELEEKLGDPLAAVHEFEQAVRLDPSETNYFEWGSELLLHRAVWQAKDVFQKGAEAYPRSARMLTALGTALFAGARYDNAAQRLCDASDLNSADPEPYVFMGKIEMASPHPLACVEQKLARFVQQQPDNSLANYLYAMAILKRQVQPADERARQHAETLLTKAVTIDGKFADAYLQLGILYASQRNFESAIDCYKKAIEANPKLGEAHYRLGAAYDRIGQPEKANQEFQLHGQIKKLEADAIDRQRREVKQFLVVLPDNSANSPVH